MFDTYPVVIFECDEEGEKIWKVVFPGIADSKLYHVLRSDEQNQEGLRKILNELLSGYKTLPFPINTIEILPDEICTGRNITNVVKSWVCVVNYKEGDEI